MALNVFAHSARQNTHPVRVRSLDHRSMEDAMQHDLVDYIINGSADDDTRSRASHPSTASCVHFEHTLVASGAAPCVQNEHSLLGSGTMLCVQNEHTHAALPVMSPHRLLRCLIVLGWSERELARRIGRHQTTIRRWTEGISVVDCDVAEWLEALARFHTTHPAPRAVTAIGCDSGRLVPAL